MSKDALSSQMFFDPEALQRVFSYNGFPAARFLEQALAESRNIAEAQFALAMAYAKATAALAEACFGVMPPPEGKREHPSWEARAPERAEA